MRNKIITVIFGILVAVILIEVGLRAASVVIKSKRNNFSQKIIADEAFVILCLGDSVTYGVGDNEGGGYPKKLEIILNKKLNKKVTVINKGVPFASTAGVLKNLKDSLEKFPNVDLVIILTGGRQ